MKWKGRRQSDNVIDSRFRRDYESGRLQDGDTFSMPYDQL
jgi:hypothetical protein